jgi:hypothetical protein
MGVMACGRHYCRNILCDRLIFNGSRDESRCICDDCHAELLAWRQTWPETVEVRDVHELIVYFMDHTTPGTMAKRESSPGGVQEEFERLTG